MSEEVTDIHDVHYQLPIENYSRERLIEIARAAIRYVDLSTKDLGVALQEYKMLELAIKGDGIEA